MPDDIANLVFKVSTDGGYAETIKTINNDLAGIGSRLDKVSGRTLSFSFDEKAVESARAKVESIFASVDTSALKGSFESVKAMAADAGAAVEKFRSGLGSLFAGSVMEDAAKPVADAVKKLKKAKEAQKAADKAAKEEQRASEKAAREERKASEKAVQVGVSSFRDALSAYKGIAREFQDVMSGKADLPLGRTLAGMKGEMEAARAEAVRLSEAVGLGDAVKGAAARRALDEFDRNMERAESRRAAAERKAAQGGRGKGLEDERKAMISRLNMSIKNLRVKREENAEAARGLKILDDQTRSYEAHKAEIEAIQKSIAQIDVSIAANIAKLREVDMAAYTRQLLAQKKFSLGQKTRTDRLDASLKTRQDAVIASAKGNKGMYDAAGADSADIMQQIEKGVFKEKADEEAHLRTDVGGLIGTAAGYINEVAKELEEGTGSYGGTKRAVEELSASMDRQRRTAKGVASATDNAAQSLERQALAAKLAAKHQASHNTVLLRTAGMQSLLARRMDMANANIMADRLSSLSASAKAASVSLSDTGKSLGFYFSSYMLAGKFRKAMASANAFGLEIRRIQSLARDFDFDRLYDGLMRLDARFGNVIHNAKALYWAYSSGVRGTEEDLVRFTETMSKAAIAINADVMPTMDAATTIMNAYGKSAADAGEIADLMFMIVKEGKADARQLTASLGQVVATASALGVELDEMGAAAATLSKTISTNKALTYLNNVMSKLAAPTKDMEESARRLGVELGADAVKAKGFAAVLKELHAATGGDIGRLAQIFPDVRSQKAAFTLLSTQYMDFESILGRVRGKEGAMEDALSAVTDTPEQQVIALKNAMSMLAVEIGWMSRNLLLLGGALSPLVNAFNAMSASGKKFAGYGAMAAGSFAAIAMVEKAGNAMRAASIRLQSDYNMSLAENGRASLENVLAKRRLADASNQEALASMRAARAEAEQGSAVLQQARADKEAADDRLRQMRLEAQNEKVLIGIRDEAYRREVRNEAAASAARRSAVEGLKREVKYDSAYSVPANATIQEKNLQERVNAASKYMSQVQMAISAMENAASAQDLSMVRALRGQWLENGKGKMAIDPGSLKSAGDFVKALDAQKQVFGAMSAAMKVASSAGSSPVVADSLAKAYAEYEKVLAALNQKAGVMSEDVLKRLAGKLLVEGMSSMRASVDSMNKAAFAEAGVGFQASQYDAVLKQEAELLAAKERVADADRRIAELRKEAGIDEMERLEKLKQAEADRAAAKTARLEEEMKLAQRVSESWIRNATVVGGGYAREAVSVSGANYRSLAERYAPDSGEGAEERTLKLYKARELYLEGMKGRAGGTQEWAEERKAVQSAIKEIEIAIARRRMYGDVSKSNLSIIEKGVAAQRKAVEVAKKVVEVAEARQEALVKSGRHSIESAAEVVRLEEKRNALEKERAALAGREDAAMYQRTALAQRRMEGSYANAYAMGSGMFSGGMASTASSMLSRGVASSLGPLGVLAYGLNVPGMVGGGAGMAVRAVAGSAVFVKRFNITAKEMGQVIRYATMSSRAMTAAMIAENAAQNVRIAATKAHTAAMAIAAGGLFAVAAGVALLSAKTSAFDKIGEEIYNWFTDDLANRVADLRDKQAELYRERKNAMAEEREHLMSVSGTLKNQKRLSESIRALLAPVVSNGRTSRALFAGELASANRKKATGLGKGGLAMFEEAMRELSVIEFEIDGGVARRAALSFAEAFDFNEGVMRAMEDSFRNSGDLEEEVRQAERRLSGAKSTVAALRDRFAKELSSYSDVEALQRAIQEKYTALQDKRRERDLRAATLSEYEGSEAFRDGSSDHRRYKAEAEKAEKAYSEAEKEYGDLKERSVSSMSKLFQAMSAVIDANTKKLVGKVKKIGEDAKFESLYEGGRAEFAAKFKAERAARDAVRSQASGLAGTLKGWGVDPRGIYRSLKEDTVFDVSELERLKTGVGRRSGRSGYGVRMKAYAARMKRFEPAVMEEQRLLAAVQSARGKADAISSAKTKASSGRFGGASAAVGMAVEERKAMDDLRKAEAELAAYRKANSGRLRGYANAKRGYESMAAGASREEARNIMVDRRLGRFSKTMEQIETLNKAHKEAIAAVNAELVKMGGRIADYRGGVLTETRALSASVLEHAMESPAAYGTTFRRAAGRYMANESAVSMGAKRRFMGSRAATMGVSAAELASDPAKMFDYMESLDKMKAAYKDVTEADGRRLALMKRLADAERNANMEAVKFAQSLQTKFNDSHLQKAAEAGSIEGWELMNRSFSASPVMYDARTAMQRSLLNEQMRSEKNREFMLKSMSEASVALQNAVGALSVDRNGNSFQGVILAQEKGNEILGQIKGNLDYLSGIKPVYFK